MTRSLLDSDYVIQRAAMDGLLEDTKKEFPALIEYLSKNPQSRISNLAIIELNKIESSYEIFISILLSIGQLFLLNANEEE